MSHKPYNAFSEFLKNKYQTKVRKISIDAGFSCPNRDGKIGVSGCTFCNNHAFSPNQRQGKKSIPDQIKEGKMVLSRKMGARKFIAYFQAHTNTYDKPDTLKHKYAQALQDSDIVGLSIGTRPDCLSEEILDVLEEMGSTTNLLIEIGLQSANDKTLTKINRGHTSAVFADAVQRVRNRKIDVCCHVILGLPDEGSNDFNHTACVLSNLDIQGVKIIPLYICKGTPMEQDFRHGRVTAMEFEQYRDAAIAFLEHTRNDILIHRLSARVPEELLVAPLWLNGGKNAVVEIEKEMIRKNKRQGALH